MSTLPHGYATNAEMLAATLSKGDRRSRSHPHSIEWKRPDGTTGSLTEGTWDGANNTFVNMMVHLPAGSEVSLRDSKGILARCIVLAP